MLYLLREIFLLLAREKALKVFGSCLHVRCLRPLFGRGKSPGSLFVSSRIERSSRNSICLFSEPFSCWASSARFAWGSPICFAVAPSYVDRSVFFFFSLARRLRTAFRLFHPVVPV